jgi:hypothetical protein
MFGFLTFVVSVLILQKNINYGLALDLNKHSPEMLFVNSALQFYSDLSGKNSANQNNAKPNQFFGSKSSKSANSNYATSPTVASQSPAPSNTNNQSIIKVEPMVQWVNSNDFMELISYLAEQTKYMPKKNYVIMDTRNSNEYNGWKSFSKASAKTSDQSSSVNSGLIGLYDQKNGHITHAHKYYRNYVKVVVL